MPRPKHGLSKSGSTEMVIGVLSCGSDGAVTRLTSVSFKKHEIVTIVPCPGGSVAVLGEINSANRLLVEKTIADLVAGLAP
jgi:hypothetical protein